MVNILKFLPFLVLTLSLSISDKTSFAENLEAISLEEKTITSGLYTDINDLVEYRAERGLRNLEPHSIVLINEGLKAYKKNRKKEAILLFKKASELSPDLPTPYLYLAKAHVSFSLKGFSVASGYLLAALHAFFNNFWWTFHIAGIVLINLFLALYIATIVFLIALISSKFSTYIHDIIEDKSKIYYILPSIFLVFFGPIFGAIGFTLPFWIYMKRKEKVILYCIIGVSMVVVLAFPLFSSFLGVSQDKTLRTIVKINSGIYSGEKPDREREERSYEAVFTYALDLKRRGYYDEAKNMYKGLLGKGDDARTYNNLANCYVGLGDYDKALSYYEKSLEIAERVSTYYNLSQIYREIFDFGGAEEYYQNAIKLNRKKVDFYNSVKGTSVNRFVMDEHLDNKELWYLAFQWYPYYKSSKSFRKMFFFTNRGVAIALFLLLLLVFYVYNMRASYGAYRCGRCGEIYCSRCEKRISRENICLKCFRTLVKVSEMNPRERIERILEIQHYKDSRNQRLKILTILFPGTGHIYYGWSVYGFIILLLFIFFLFSTLLWFYIPAPVSMNQTVSFFRWMSLSGFVLVYVIAVLNVLRRTPRKWL